MTPKYKGLIVILDGLGDRPTSMFKGHTPLEEAYTPQLDRLTAAGICGMVDPLAPGIPVATHTGTGVMLGLAPTDAMQLARGPVEAAGIGLPIGPGDVALRCNFATLEADGERLKILDRRADRIKVGTEELAAELHQLSLGDGITATLLPSTQHRAVLQLSGSGLSANISDTDPGGDQGLLHVQPCSAITPSDAAATRTAAALNRFIQTAHTKLSTHPVNLQRQQQGLVAANGIITRGAGIYHQVNNLINHLGLQAALIASEGSVCGLGNLFGYTVINQPSFTALANTDIDAKISAARSALNSHDIVFLHLKAPDICAHDLDPVAKMEFIERFDEALLPLLTDNLVIGISGDHSTDSSSGCHCSDPVPSLIYAPGARTDSCRSFGETECMSGGLSRISATSFLLMVLDAMRSLHNFKPDDCIYFNQHLH